MNSRLGIGLLCVIAAAVLIAGITGFVGFRAADARIANLEKEKLELAQAKEVAENELALRRKPEADLVDSLRADLAKQAADLTAAMEQQKFHYNNTITTLQAQIISLNQGTVVPELAALQGFVKTGHLTEQGLAELSRGVGALTRRVSELEKRSVCHCGK